MNPAISVIIPHYENPAGLDLVLAGLEAQRLPAGTFEVILADDGSTRPPAPAPRPFDVRVVTQEDLGFRAAAARNLGASLARGEVLCFLDADTVPTPNYLERLVAPCADGWTLTVGRREHADLTGWDGSRLRQAFAGGAGPDLLPYPTWLADGYRATDNLRNADDASFRFVISAVLAVPRRLFDRVGGFDAAFVGYGGEDWDLANRCWLAGADLRHVPEAVAWHDGPDAAARDDFVRVKNAETLALSTVVTHPIVRGTGLVHAIPDIAVSLDVTGWTLGQTVVCVQSLLDGTDTGVWLTGGEPPLDDPRVHPGPIPDRVLDRCRFRIRSDRPFALQDDAADLEPQAQVTSTRALNRARHDGTEPLWFGLPDATPLDPDVVVERWRGDRP